MIRQDMPAAPLGVVLPCLFFLQSDVWAVDFDCSQILRALVGASNADKVLLLLQLEIRLSSAADVNNCTREIPGSVVTMPADHWTIASLLCRLLDV